MEHDDDGCDCDLCDLVLTEPLAHVLAAAGKRAGNTWLYCLYCDRFFQARHLRRDYIGNMQGCAFCECAGFDVAIHLWSTFGRGHPRWPRSTAELTHGRRSPDSEQDTRSP